MYSIEVLSESNAYQWEEFNKRSREGTLFHSMQWKKFLEDTLKLRLKYYLILENRKVVGICPCIEQSVLGFRGLTDVPHSEVNNLILDDSFDFSRINDVLALFSKECSFLHFNTYNPNILDRIAYDSTTVESTGNMILNLKQKPPDEIWGGFSKDMRYNIRIFEKKGFEVREVHQQPDVETFYRYYAENLKYINGEILPYSFFQRLLESYSPKELRTVALTNNGLYAGGSLTIADPAEDTAYFDYMALNRELPNKYTPSYYLSWEGITWAWENGYEKISFGRQNFDPDNPRFRNKAKFGAEYVPIHSTLVLFSKATSVLYRLKKRLEEGQETQSKRISCASEAH